MSTQRDKPEASFPDHLTADAWDHDLHAYQTRNMKPDSRPDMEPAPEPEPLSFQCDRCGNVTRPPGMAKRRDRLHRPKQLLSLPGAPRRGRRG